MSLHIKRFTIEFVFINLGVSGNSQTCNKLNFELVFLPKQIFVYSLTVSWWPVLQVLNICVWPNVKIVNCTNITPVTLTNYSGP